MKWGELGVTIGLLTASLPAMKPMKPAFASSSCPYELSLKYQWALVPAWAALVTHFNTDLSRDKKQERGWDLPVAESIVPSCHSPTQTPELGSGQTEPPSESLSGKPRENSFGALQRGEKGK